jgi:hypothetical protein
MDHVLRMIGIVFYLLPVYIDFSTGNVNLLDPKACITVNSVLTQNVCSGIIVI